MSQRISGDLLWSQLAARAWCDGAFMKRLRSDPRNVLVENGMEMPEGMGVEVVEGAEVGVVDDMDTVRRFTLPSNPPDELTEEDLVGGAVAQSFSAACAVCAA